MYIRVCMRVFSIIICSETAVRKQKGSYVIRFNAPGRAASGVFNRPADQLTLTESARAPSHQLVTGAGWHLSLRLFAQ